MSELLENDVGKSGKKTGARGADGIMERYARHALNNLLRQGGLFFPHEPSADSSLIDIAHIFRLSLPPATGKTPPAASSVLGPADTGAIAEYQTHRAVRALEKRLNAPLGFADPRVFVIIVNPAAANYSTAITEDMSSDLRLGDPEHAFSYIHDSFSRIWALDADGLAPCRAPENLETIFLEKRKWAENNRAFFGAAPRVHVQDDLAYAYEKRESTLVVLGALPAWDRIDRELRDNEARLPHRPASTSLAYSPMPLSQYWREYAAYLEHRPETSHGEPLTPPQYRERLQERQWLRDCRLRLLKAYTGLHRAKARDDDPLADNQAFFFRLAEVFVGEVGRGFVSLATEPAILSHPDMANLRKSVLTTFDDIVVDDVFPAHRGASGDATAQAGSLPYAVCSMTKSASGRKGDCEARYHRDMELDLSTAFVDRYPDPLAGIPYLSLSPRKNNKYLLQPAKASREYLSWPSLPELAASAPPIGGPLEKHQAGLIDIDKSILEERMRAYFSPLTPWKKLAAMKTGLTESRERFNPVAMRKEMVSSSYYSSDSIQRYIFKPFDERWCYYGTAKTLWGYQKTHLAALVAPDNRFVVARAGKVVADEGVPFFATSHLGDSDLLRGHSCYFPLWFHDEKGNQVANISEKATAYLTALDILPAIGKMSASRLIWNHVLAIGFSSAYLHENAEGVGQGWARIPFPCGQNADAATNEKARAALGESSRLGKVVAELLNPPTDTYAFQPVSSTVRLQYIAIPPWRRDNEESFYRDDTRPIYVNAGWGKLSKDKSVLPSHGRLYSRDYSPEERHALETSAWTEGVHAGGAYHCLGEETYDIHLNEEACVTNIPANVWRFTIGGYQVLKKWLSYRETSILGRPLTRAEVNDFCQIARRIATLLLLGPRLNRNYAVIRDLHRLRIEE